MFQFESQTDQIVISDLKNTIFQKSNIREKSKISVAELSCEPLDVPDLLVWKNWTNYY